VTRLANALGRILVRVGAWLAVPGILVAMLGGWIVARTWR
jgi:hypothetical protein